MFGKGQLLAVAEEVGCATCTMFNPAEPLIWPRQMSNWVRLHAPSGCLGGKLNTDLNQASWPDFGKLRMNQLTHDEEGMFSSLSLSVSAYSKHFSNNPFELHVSTVCVCVH